MLVEQYSCAAGCKMGIKSTGIAVACVVGVFGSGAASAETDAFTHDLRVLRDEYVLKSGALGVAQRKQALSQIAELEAGPELGKLDLFLAVSRITAIADNAHDSAMRGKNAWQPQARLPIRFIWFPDALLIARAPATHADILGSQVLSIDGHSPTALMVKLRALQGGTDEYRRWQLGWALASPEVLHALGVSQSTASVTLQLKDRRGKISSRTIAAVPSGELPPGARSGSFWSPTSLPGEVAAGWASASIPVSPPLYLQEPEKLFRLVEVPGLQALYVQFRSNMDEGEQRISPFVEELTQRLDDSPPRNLILDLRFNTGGDTTKTRELMRHIASRVPGQIYVLVGPYTFSAGIASAAALKHDGGAKVKIIGSEVGDRMRWWSEGATVCLPSSDICVRRTDGLWDINRPCSKETGCYSDRFDLAVPSLKPEMLAPILSGDWLQAKDPGLDAVRTHLRSTSPIG